MKIVFDCERMKYENTGLFTYCLQMGLHLQKLINNGDEQLNYFIPPKHRGAFGNCNNYLLQNSAQKFRMPSLRNFDIWHCTYQSSNYVPRLNKKVKVLLTIHDLNFLYDDSKTEAKKKKYVRFLQSNINRSQAIICISEFCKQDVLKHCDVKNKPIYLVYNGTNTLQSPTLFGNSYMPRTRFLFSIGVMNRKKNYHVLLPLLQRNENMELLIAGRPDDTDYIHFMNDMAKKLGVAHKVRMLGSISEGEKSWYYQNCYAFTFPSIAEGFGLPVTEAMSLGKPVFLSDKAALPEIGKDMAFYFEDFNEHQMQSVFTDGMRKYQNNAAMKEAIKKRSSEFSWAKAAMKCLEIYRSL
jgi:glycosyltransferase involved in cell wall biosynthesis